MVQKVKLIQPIGKAIKRIIRDRHFVGPSKTRKTYEANRMFEQKIVCFLLETCFSLHFLLGFRVEALFSLLLLNGNACCYLRLLLIFGWN